MNSPENNGAACRARRREALRFFRQAESPALKGAGLCVPFSAGETLRRYPAAWAGAPPGGETRRAAAPDSGDCSRSGAEPFIISI